MSKSNLSAKEREILERQKKIASKIKPGTFADDSTNPSSARPAKPPPPPGAPKPKAPSVIDLTKSSSASTAAAASSKPAPSAQKRPTLKRKGIAMQANAPSTTKSDRPTKRPSLLSGDTAIKVERKEKKAPPAGSLAKLVQHVSTTSNDGTVPSDAMLPTIKADDFWNYLRNWDFCTQFGETLGPNSHSEGAQSARKPLPNIFLNVKQYIALWAPLCMAECKAQVIQEAATGMTAPLAVKVTTGASSLRHPHNRGNFNNQAVVDFTSAFEEHETATYVKLTPEQRGKGDNMSFMTHDLCLLLAADRRDLLKQLRQGTAVLPAQETSWDLAGLVGHVEATRKGVFGLTLKVSKRKWAKMRNTNLMYLVKLGCNITALREFTALCRVDMLPLQKYLLGQHLERDKPRKLSRHQSTQQLLNQMGGKAALGEGFLHYAQNKFNNSQLTAIAASAAEYGDGGFTLIKGPPGTGSKFTNSLYLWPF